MKIQSRLTMMGASVGISTLVAVLLAVAWQSYEFRGAATGEVDKLIASDLNRVTQSAYDLVQSQDQSIQQRVGSGLSVAQLLLHQNGGLSLSSDHVSWQATNQFTHEKQSVTLPRVLIGSKWLGQNRDVSTSEPLVDDVMQLTGVTTTVFQKMDAQGDLLRVATRVQGKDGKRAIGTFIPAQNLDGTPNKVVSAIMSGHTFTGNAYVVNAWYVSTYMPLFDSQHHVIGALYAGMKQESISALRNSLQHITVGKTGHVVVLSASGSAQGTYLISPDGAEDGTNIWNAKDANGQAYVQSITKAATGADEETSVDVRYSIKNSETGVVSNQIGRAMYYKPWDWLIVAQTDEADYASFGAGLLALQEKMLLILALVGMVVGFLAHVIFGYYSGRLARRINQMVYVADKIAAGETDIPRTELLSSSNDSAETNDELVRLERSFVSAVTHLNQMAAAAELIASGDLRQDVLAKSQNDRLGMSFQRMTHQLRQLLSALTDCSRRIGSATDTLRLSADASVEAVQRVSSATREVAETSKESAIGANDVAKHNAEQAIQVAQASDHLKRLSLTTATVSNDARTTMDAAKQADEAALNGVSIVGQTVQGMETIRKTVADAAIVITELGQSSHQIGTIVETINHIAEQTNLLALNAAIEAARAGESGRGFAVVADEVRKLASRSADATRDIEKLIGDVQGQTNKAVAAMRNGTTGVEAGVLLAEQAGDALASIQERNSLVVERVTKILVAANEMSVVTTSIAKTVDNVAELTDVSSAAAEEVSAGAAEVADAVRIVSLSTEEELKNVEKVNVATHELISIVKQLEGLVNQYHVEDEEQALTMRRAA